MPVDENLSVPKREKKWRLGFWSLIAAQFQGAFNDNGLKFFVIFLILGTNPTDSQKYFLVFVIGNLFALPFLLFSMAGGFLADRFSKRSVTIATKIFEVCAMLFAMYAFTRGNTRMAYAVIFLASTQAAFFGPSKYGLLPELLPDKLLSWGNGILELTTFLAIIAGAVIGPSLAQHFHGREAIAGLIFGACSLFGLAASFGISRVPPADPSKKFSFNIFGDLNKQIQLVRPKRVLHLAIAGNTYFWFLGAMLQFVIVFYGRQVLHLDETRGGYLQAALAIGIGVGSYAAGLLSSGKIEYGLIPLGAIGMSAFAFAIAIHGLSFFQVLFLLGALGFAGVSFVRGSNHRVGDVLRRDSLSAHGAGVFLHLDSSDVASGHALHDLSVAGFFAALDAVDCHAHAVPPGRGRAGECTRAWWGVADPQSRLHGRRGAAHRVHRPADSLHHVQGLLRPPARKTVCKDHGRDSHRIGPRTARNDPFLAPGHGGPEEW